MMTRSCTIYLEGSESAVKFRRGSVVDAQRLHSPDLLNWFCD